MKKRKKLFTRVLCMMCMAALAIFTVVSNMDVDYALAAESDIAWNQLGTVFPDAYVCEQVKAELIYNGIAEGTTITQENLNDISSLSVKREEGAFNLKGLERLQGLESLSLYGNIQSLAPLNNLTKLDTLYLNGVTNALSFGEMSKVSSLTHVIIISCDGITSLDGLENNKGMKCVRTHTASNLTDISACASFTELEEANLYASYSLEDISALSNLQKLNKVDISNSKVADITVLKGKASIETLNIDFTNLLAVNMDSTCEVLKSLTGLKSLGLRSANVNDEAFEKICNLTNLTSLDLLNNDVTNIESVSKLTNLECLDIGGNKISNFSPLAKLSNLRVYSVSNSGTKDQYVKYEGDERTISNPFVGMDGKPIVPDESEKWIYNAADNTITFTDNKSTYVNFAVTGMNYNGKTFDMELYFAYEGIVDEITIKSQPESVSCTKGDTVTLSVEAESYDDNFTYEWYKDETKISKESSATLTIKESELDDSGSYKCVISNATASVTSEAAVVAVKEKAEDVTTEEITTEGATTEGATTEGATTEGVTTEGATTEGATTEGATTEGATTEGATTEGVTTEGATADAISDNAPSTGDVDIAVAFMAMLFSTIGLGLIWKKKLIDGR